MVFPDFAFYALSVENINSRPARELNFLYKIFRDTFRDMNKDKMMKEGVRIRFIGDLDLLPDNLRKECLNLEKETANNDNLLVNFAVAYGGRQELIEAVRKIIDKKVSGDEVTAGVIEDNLYLSSEPDFIIRTGGEKRTSNFLLWQASYSEWFFLDKMWPEFTKEDLVRCIEEFKKFVNKYQIPVVYTSSGSSILGSENKFCIGSIGSQGCSREGAFTVQNCDLLIVLGSRLNSLTIGLDVKKFARNAKKIMVDIDKIEINRSNVNLDEKINCDASYFLKSLLKYLPNKINLSKNWLKYCKNVRKKYPIVLEKFKTQKKFVNSYYFIDVLSDVLNNKDIIVTDMGLSFVGTHQAFRIKKGQKLYTNSGHAPMGWGLPAAVGACYASKKRRIICLAGEGGLQMNIQELATVMHNKLPIKIFIYNNGGYLTIKQTQQLGFNSRVMGSNSESGISFPDYGKIAQSHKIKYMKIVNNKNLKKKINKILIGNKPMICELMLDHNQEQMPKAINRRMPGGKSVATKYEDMYPFLSSAEIQENML